MDMGRLPTGIFVIESIPKMRVGKRDGGGEASEQMCFWAYNSDSSTTPIIKIYYRLSRIRNKIKNKESIFAIFTGKLKFQKCSQK